MMLVLAVFFASSLLALVQKTRVTSQFLFQKMREDSVEFGVSTSIATLGNDTYYALPPRTDYGAKPQERYSLAECLLRSYFPSVPLDEEIQCP